MAELKEKPDFSVKDAMKIVRMSFCFTWSSSFD